MSVTLNCSIARCNYINVRPNYTTVSINYDAIGQLTEDDAEEIASIDWTVYNKVKKVTRATGSLRNDLEFFYDANGHRIAKYVKPRTAGGVKDELYWDLYYYVRDAQGNTMATYKRYFTDDDAIGGSTWFDVTDLIETPIYGSSRIGLNDEDRTEAIALDCGGCGNQLLTHANRSVTPTNYLADSVNFARVLGQRRYEQTNHLGNVLTTVSDRKIQEDGSGTDNGTVGVVDYYMPNVKSAVMYYPYGKPLPSYGTGYGTTYRYSFNGKEQDTEYADYYSGMQDYGFRFYSSDYIRFPSRDPLFREYPNLTIYQFASNSPVWAIDLDGLEALIITERQTKTSVITRQVYWSDLYNTGPAYGALGIGVRKIRYNQDGTVLSDEYFNTGGLQNFTHVLDVTTDPERKNKFGELIDAPATEIIEDVEDVFGFGSGNTPQDLGTGDTPPIKDPGNSVHTTSGTPDNNGFVDSKTFPDSVEKRKISGTHSTFETRDKKTKKVLDTYPVDPDKVFPGFQNNLFEHQEQQQNDK